MGSPCDKSDKSWERFAIFSKQTEILITFLNELPSAVLENLSGSTVFSIQNLCTMSLRSLRCIGFSSRSPNFHNWEQGLRFIAEME